MKFSITRLLIMITIVGVFLGITVPTTNALVRGMPDDARAYIVGVFAGCIGTVVTFLVAWGLYECSGEIEEYLKHGPKNTPTGKGKKKSKNKVTRKERLAEVWKRRTHKEGNR